MTVHKLSAGNGYTYLTRQVASADERRPAGQSLSEYYVARGNPPGVWAGRGAEQLGLVGSEVSESQMRALFGEGRHPDGVHKLGAAYPNYTALPAYADRVAARVEEFVSLNGRPPSAAERNRIAAVEARRGRRAVAGFDLVFTPVKSASVLWALGGPEVRAAVEAAHHEAVASALDWLETHAAYTRVGRGGVGQIDATGLICAMFDHHESRAGDPDLHTHVAVANKVCGVDGKWRSLDARGLYALGVAASERYNTRFEDALARHLRVEFTERPTGRRDLRPVREIEGVPTELLTHFSRRRAAIEERYAELRRAYRTAHGREPDRSTQIQLAQQATLETREAKGAGPSLAEQVADWTRQATDVIGSRKLAGLVAATTGRPQQLVTADQAFVHQVACEVVRQVAEQRSTWTVWNLYAETERVLRKYRFAQPSDRPSGQNWDRDRVTEAAVAAATGPDLSVRISEPELIAESPALVRASDGSSVFRTHGSDRYTTTEVLLAEDTLVAAAHASDGPHVDPVPLEAALAVHESQTNLVLDSGQRALVEAFATSPARIVVGIGPAGAGKTTAMRAFAATWHASNTAGPSSRGRVVALATSSKAAQVLSAELGLRAENLHKFLHENKRARDQSGGPSDAWFRLAPGDVVLVDEAGMAGTLHLHQLLTLATDAGATVRLLGDPAQLAAVDAGGALGLLEREAGATHLTSLHRFADPAEGDATLALRAGDPAAVGFYAERDRITAGSRDLMLETAYEHWAHDIRTGQTSLLIAATTADVAALNARARLERATAGQVEADGVVLHDGNLAGVGDWVVTRTNDRTLTYGSRKSHRRRGGAGPGRWVHNGDLWQVTGRHQDGSLTVRHLDHAGANDSGRNSTVRLPASYVAESVELGYAATAHRAQGATVDTAHALITPEMTREGLYVASTRGRTSNRWYVATDDPSILDCEHEPDPPATVHEIVSAVLRRSSAETSASQMLRDAQDDAVNLRTLIGRYEHARDRAATDALRVAADVLPAAERARIMGDKARPYLARVLADSVGRGAHGPTLLRRAHDLEPLDNVASPALVLASRIQDHPHTLGIPDHTRKAGPLPWLPAPEVGHPGWSPYLEARAELIQRRAAELGTLAAAYREHYDITPTPASPIGDPPSPDTRQAAAYQSALAELQSTPASLPRPHDRHQRRRARRPRHELNRWLRTRPGT